jgi:uncharacterized protein (TIGR04141 family)
MRYTFYVFQPDVFEFEDVLAPGSLGGKHAYEPVAVSGVKFSAQAYLQRNKPSTPSWLDFIVEFCDVENAKTIKNRYNSFVLAVQTQSGRMCALTYGQGFQALNRDKVQQDFGIDVACRLLDSASIKEVESKAVGADGLHKYQIASKPGDLATFPLQRARDRVQRLGGSSRDDGLGKRITGGTPCMIGGKLPFNRLGEVCERLVASLAKKPNARLAALRPYEPVKDVAIVAALKKKLLAALTPAECECVGLFLPEAEDWKAIETFEATWDGGTWNPLKDLDLSEIVTPARAALGKALSLDNIRVRGLSEGGAHVLDAPIADLATFETDYKGNPYALSSGKWFRLREDFVKRFNQDCENIELETTLGYLPDWTAEPTEYDYNSAVATANPDEFCCLDQDLVKVDGEAIEASDLVSMAGHFIHVKKWESSQTFSALIKQAQNSAILIDSSQEFRNGIFDKLPAKWRTKPFWEKFCAGVRPAEIRIVYAIAAKPTREIPKSIPIFSRQSLLDACAALRAQYYNVRVFHIRRP